MATSLLPRNKKTYGVSWYHQPPNPHPALRATFSRREKGKAKDNSK